MIRHARISDAGRLTRLSFESKGYWGYPKTYFEIWAGELTISADYIENNDVFVLEKDGTVIGYYSIVELKTDITVSGVKLKKGFWLEHMFIDPQFIKMGFGRKLFDHLLTRCNAQGIAELGLLSDPNAKGFYERMGCEYKGDYPSTIKNRTTPFLLLKTKGCRPCP